MGRKPADTDDTGFQGIHERYVMVIIDEAAGVADSIWEQADSLVANDLGCTLAIGNPDNPTTTFGHIFGANPVNGYAHRAGWTTATISAYDTPNFTNEPVPQRLAESLIGQRYVADKLEDLGEDDAVYRAKVLGEFTVDAEGAIIQASKIATCRREVDNDDGDYGPVRLGVDVGAGQDEFVIRAWHPKRRRAGAQWTVRTRESEEAVDLVVQAIHESGATDVNVDIIGVGWAVAGALRKRRMRGEHHARVHDVNVASKATNPKRYRNLRAELWWEMGRMVNDEVAELSTIDDQTASDLAAPRGGPDAQGFMIVEPKDETKKRIGRSPDRGDALLIATHEPVRVHGHARVLRPKG
jgi:hypothetical protein